MREWIKPNQDEKRDENTKVTMKENEEGWTKPLKFAPITHFL